MPCTAYNIPENYTSGEGRVQISLPLNWTLTAVFMGSSWFVLAQGGGNWSVAVQINTFKRTDGRYNQAPIVTMLPIIRLKRYRTYNIKINVADNDFDPYQFFVKSIYKLAPRRSPNQSFGLYFDCKSSGIIIFC